MNYRIESKGPFEMFRAYGLVNSDPKKVDDVAKFRRQCDLDGSVEVMNGLLGRFSNTILHAALYDHTGTSLNTW